MEQIYKWKLELTFFANVAHSDCFVYNEVCLLHVYKGYNTQQRKIKPVIGFFPLIFIYNNKQRDDLLLNWVYNVIIVPERSYFSILKILHTRALGLQIVQ